jgi:hypothetical protein
MDRSDLRAPLALRYKFRLTIAVATVLAISAWTFGLSAASPALAAECNQEIGAMMKKRQGVIDELNRLAKAAPKGQLDPTASCPKLRVLAALEKELVTYFVKNKDWCMIPDAAVTNISASAKHMQEVAGKACQVAEQIKKGQQAIGTGPKLPTGPL